MNRTLVLLVLLVSACQKYIAVPNSGADRIWIITGDQTEVFRCWDLKNQTRKPIAMCRRADILGKNEETSTSEIAERTAPPAHPDSTEPGDVQVPTTSLSDPRPPEDGLQDQLDDEAVRRGMESVRAKVAGCLRLINPPTATVTAVIGNDGRVRSARMMGRLEGDETADCVSTMVKSARFPPFRRSSMPVTYTFGGR